MVPPHKLDSFAELGAGDGGRPDGSRIEFLRQWSWLQTPIPIEYGGLGDIKTTKVYVQTSY